MQFQKALRGTGPIALLIGVFAVQAPAAQSSPDKPLGVVISSQRTLLGATYLADGTSLFGGDTISTQEKGSLRMRVGDANLAIGENSVLALSRDQRSIRAVLIAGKVQFSIAAGSTVIIDALGAAISAPQHTASGVVAIVGASEFQISSTHGSLSVNVDGDVRTVAEGANYRVTLSVSEDAPIRVIDGKKWKIAAWIFIGVIAGVTALAVQRATLSPSHPQS